MQAPRFNCAQTLWSLAVIRQQCAQGDPIAVLRSMVMDIDYESWLRQNASSDKVADARMGNVWFLIEALKNTLEKDEEGNITIEEAIGKLVLRDMLERQQEEEEGEPGGVDPVKGGAVLEVDGVGEGLVAEEAHGAEVAEDVEGDHQVAREEGGEELGQGHPEEDPPRGVA